MLPAENRLRRRQDFSVAVRRGRRAGRRTVVVHLRTQPEAHATQPRVGLVVGRAVGPSVVRNQVKRRLRHVLRSRLSALPAGSLLVVRASPAAATASSAVLAADVDKALARVLGPVGPGSPAPRPAAEGVS